MTEKAIDSSGDGFLILILPVAFLIIFLFATWPVLLGLVVLGAILNVWQRYQWQRWSQQVNPVFHKLIQENRGCITAMDLAMKANFSAQTAKRYLDTKAQEFGAQHQDYEGKGRVYYFITASTLGSILDDSEPQSLPKSETFATNARELPEPLAQQQMQPESLIKDEEQHSSTNHQQSPHGALIQVELAKRLDVHSSTVYKRRADPDFPEWSRSRDPEGVAWEYLPETKDFAPVLEMGQ